MRGMMILAACTVFNLAAGRALAEPPDSTVEIMDWVANRATCREIIGNVRGGAEADFENPAGTVMLMFMTYARGYGAARGLNENQSFLDLMAKCVASPGLRLEHVARK